MRVSMKLGILHFAEVNLTMPTKQEFLDTYRDSQNYQAESVSGNRSHKYEQGK